MSHVATIDVQITDLDDLDAACRRLGLELVRGQQTYRWYGEHVGDFGLPDGFTEEELGTCEHAIRLNATQAAALRDSFGDDPYEIGVVRRRDGKPGWSLLWDFYQEGYGLERVIGQNAGRLRQAYAIEAAKRQAKRQGFRVLEQRLPGGAVELKLSKR